MVQKPSALVAQLDRASAFEADSLRVTTSPTAAAETEIALAEAEAEVDRLTDLIDDLRRRSADALRRVEVLLAATGMSEREVDLYAARPDGPDAVRRHILKAVR